jgi:hypothetical protein
MIAARIYLFSSVVLLAGVVAALLPGNAQHVSKPHSGTQGSNFNPKLVQVYVSPFDISAAPGKEPVAITRPPAPQKPQSGTNVSGESPHVLKDADTSSIQADRLKSFFGDALLQALRKNGFNAAPVGSTRPEKGVLLKGVFAEVDSQNHNCLAILGGTTPASSFVLYMGAYNLARPDQPLYRVMTMENCDAQYGPVISLNNYIPMDKYAVSKNPTEDEVRRACAQIVANLRALLSVNSAAFSN